MTALRVLAIVLATTIVSGTLISTQVRNIAHYEMGSFFFLFFFFLPKAYGLCFDIQFLCKSGQCLNGKNERVCDGSTNCAGGDDESRCGKGKARGLVRE